MEYNPIKSSGGGESTNISSSGGASNYGDGPVAKVRQVLGQALSWVKSRLPDTSGLYLQPLDPSTDLSTADRVRLVGESIRPWREFFNFFAYNLPPLNQIAPRVGRNIQNYFYNYFILTIIHICVFTVFHIGTMLAVAVWAAILFFLYIKNESDIAVGSNFVIDGNIKFVIAVATGIFLLFVGHVFSLVWSLLFFWLIVVGIHSLVRDDISDDEVIGSI